jgi:hypothetical protein
LLAAGLREILCNFSVVCLNAPDDCPLQFAAHVASGGGARIFSNVTGQTGGTGSGS